MLKHSLMLSLLMIVLACATRGHNFSSDLSWIQKNKTTKEQVKARLGEPFSVGFSGDQRTWTYGYYHFSLFGKSYTKELKIYWNREGTVDRFVFSSSFPQDIRQEKNQPVPQETSQQ